MNEHNLKGDVSVRGNLVPLNYEKLGLKCGLEIHQQLDAENKKLFCNCLSVLRQDEPDYSVKRKLHVVAGESGEVDLVAEYQAFLDKKFIYQAYDSNCLVELDESPPNLINEEALKVALQIALLLNMKIFPITQIMRKTVIDGSNTSGFQRTVLIARDGWIETVFGKIKIETLCLEEDAARIISQNNNEIIYRLDRLGIPLVEIATAPEIKNPQHAREVALHIGEILRSCKIKRGIGTIRQDVNMSIKNGFRVEIKGVQEPALISKTIVGEIERQQKEKLVAGEVRKALPDGKTEFLRPLPGAARMYPETDLPLLKISRDFINKTKKNLPKLQKENEEELKKKGLSHEMIKLVLEGYLGDFESLLKIYPQDPELIAKMLTIWRRELATKLKQKINVVSEVINIDILEKLLEEIKKGNLSKNQIKQIFNELMKNTSVNDAIKNIKKEKVEVLELEEKIMNLVKSKPRLSPNAYMGILMKELNGKIDAKTLMEIIKKYVK